MPAQRGQSRHRNVVEIELIGNMQADVFCVGVVDLHHLNVEQHLGQRLAHSFHKLRGRPQHVQRCAHRDGVVDRAGHHKTKFKRAPQGIHDVLQILGSIGGGDAKYAHAHAIEKAMVVGRIGGGKQDRIFYRYREALCDRAGRVHRSRKISLLDVEANPPRLKALVEGDGQSVA